MQGRKLHRVRRPCQGGGEDEEERKKRVGNFNDVTYLGMAFGDPRELFKDFPRQAAAAANFGVSHHTIRRARSLAAKSSLLIQDNCIKKACMQQKDGVRAVKIGWDETGVRLVCDLEKVQRLMPQLVFTKEDARSHCSSKRGNSAKPSFRLQVMQQHCCAKVGEISGPVQVPAKFVKSTAAEDLYSGCSAFELIDLIKKDAPDAEDVTMVGACADSLESNKNVVVKCAMDHPDAMVVNGVCMGCR